MKLKGFQSEVSEQEILRLRNDLLKYELDKEKLELELQEERKAHVEREQRIKEQELKIENLSSLVITSAFDDAMNKENGKHLENRPSQNNFQNGLVTVRRDRHLSPLNFELLPDRSSERNAVGSKRELDFEELLNFENVADEDLWATMNDGKPLAEPDFLFSTPSRWTSSVGSTKERGSSSVICALMSSRVKMERYRSQLEEAWRENSELQAQIQEQCTFQAELRNELVQLEKECASLKSTSNMAEEFWDGVKQAKSSYSKLISEFLLMEKTHLKSAFLQANEVRNKQVESLATKIAELEEELVECRDEKARLQTRCQAMVEQIQSLTANAKREGESSVLSSPIREADVPSSLHESDGDKVSEERSTIPGGLSNGGTTCPSKVKGTLDSWQRMAGNVAEMGTSAWSMQKDHRGRVSDDGWLQRKGNRDDASSEERMTSGHKAFTMAAVNNSSSPRHSTVDGRGAAKDLKAETEMLLMSKEHIRALERQVLLANLEKDRTKALLKQQLDTHEKSVAAMKLQKRRFAEELKSIMEAIAIQDNFVTSICHGIKGFDQRGDFECPSALRQIPL